MMNTIRDWRNYPSRLGSELHNVLENPTESAGSTLVMHLSELLIFLCESLPCPPHRRPRIVRLDKSQDIFEARICLCICFLANIYVLSILAQIS